MPRSLDPVVENLVQGKQLTRVIFAELEFFSPQTQNSTFTRMWTGIGDITFQSQIFTGVGTLGEVSGVSEATDMRAGRVSLSLSGIDPSTIAFAVDFEYQDRQCNIWEGFLDSEGALIGSEQVFRGFIDTMTISDGETAVIQISAESRNRVLRRPKPRFYTDADQQSKFPGDFGFNQVENIQNKEIRWGVANAGTI